MPCETAGKVTICYGPEMKVIRDESVGERWCFGCRKVQEFRFIVKAPVGESWYGPSPSVTCSSCGKYDGDLFPGREREWED